MAWRSIVITQPSRLRLAQRALLVEQDEGTVRVPLEDISVLVIDQPQVNLTAQLLSACAARQIAVVTVGDDHHPNGVLLPHLPHSRALKVMRAQLDMSQPRRKRLWQHIVQRKIHNQAAVLDRHDPIAAHRLRQLARDVRSGDTGHAESQAAQLYFRSLFGPGFSRNHACLHNAALNYGYSIIRSALARHLVAYGFLTAFGLHHRSEQNAFNLADDLIEPFRPILDAHVLRSYPPGCEEHDLTRDDKAYLVSVLHEDVALHRADGLAGKSTLLAAAEASVISLGQRLEDDATQLTLPGPLPTVEPGWSSSCEDHE
ncbi:MAG: type II CRISPR-associated endonuclease Cas1 [Pseudomonadota bacterium]|uniref:type II CRISPR-associated endonuclease Cas1 n=1 Tax=Thermithiobacillus tepidarius TaxID=929 RepID=UPI0003F88157|nr:type II CRISPR-associated endonuclease Cas1 [Thermithiobacillus tepidarius]